MSAVPNCNSNLVPMAVSQGEGNGWNLPVLESSRLCLLCILPWGQAEERRCLGLLWPLSACFQPWLHFPEVGGGKRGQLPWPASSKGSHRGCKYPITCKALTLPSWKLTISSGKGQLKNDRTAQSKEGEQPQQKLSLQCFFIITGLAHQNSG